MSAGRPPKPLEQHLIDGTYRADRHGSDGEAVQADGEPVMPEDFDGERLACWQSIVAPLVKLKIARAIDTPSLVALCEWWARYRAFGSLLDKPEEFSVMLQSRLMRLSVEAWNQFARIAARFGMTPADRMRLRVETQQKKQGVATRVRT